MKKTLRICFISFFVLLFLPIVQRSIKPLPHVQLHGTFKKAKKPKLTWKTWMDGSFQSSYEKYFNERQGMRGYLITTFNQLNYWLFKTTPDTGGTVIVAGRDNNLFERSYVELYNSTNKHSEEDLRIKVERIRRLQDELKKRGIGFIVVIAPSKVEIYPEWLRSEQLLPDRDQRQSTYDALMPILRESGIEFIDAKSLFKEWKTSFPYPLFQRTGTHWNYISSGKVTGIMMDRLSNQMGRQLPSIELESVTVDDKVYGADNDLGQLMNIWTEKKLAGPQHHPVFKVKPGDENNLPNILLVGDSFSHMLVDILNKNGLCSNTDLFYYFKRVFDSPEDEFGRKLRRSNIQWDEDIFKRDIIILVINEYWLPKIGFGFVENALEVLDAEDTPPQN